ncbi:MAG: YmdB family metallophosphoesterase [Campylobacterales bacterium]|nr:YmdB family metallophosphoesterase [Campylobacterales bacterium]
MKIAMIGDIVGRPGRSMIKQHLPRLRKEHGIDFVVANYENASHGFGLTAKNADELFKAGVDVMTGGNHSFDKKEIIPLFETLPLLRPHNYPEAMPGKGTGLYEVNGVKVGVLNVMGYYAMPMVDNPFVCAQKSVEALRREGATHILVDMHAEATSEKRALLMMLKGHVSAIIGTHTHVATDDLQIDGGTGYVTDLGLSGCRDNVIGMDAKIPLQRFLTGLPGHFNVPEKCKKILQTAVFELDEKGRCVSAKKIKTFDDGREIVTDAWEA